MSERNTITFTTISGLRVSGNRIRGYLVQREDRTPMGKVITTENGCLQFVPVVGCTLSAVEVTELAALMVGAAGLSKKG